MRDRHELVDVVVGEVDVVGDARAQTGIGAEEVVHAVLVAREDHDEVLALRLHHLQEDLDRLLPVVTFVFGAEQVVRLVDEEDAAVGAAQHLLGLGGGVADVLADEVVTRTGDHPRLGDVPQAVEDLRHLQRHRRLARPGVAGDRHVQRGAVRGQADLAAQPVDQEQRRDLADAGLDRCERDQLAVELVEHLDDVRLAEDGAEIGRVRGAEGSASSSSTSASSGSWATSTGGVRRMPNSKLLIRRRPCGA